MPVDASIALQAKPIELPNPLAYATQAATLRDLSLRAQANQVSLEQNQRALTDQKTIADLYRANMAPDGSVNHAGVIAGLANAGLGDKIPAYQQQVAAVDEAQAKALGQRVTTAGADIKNQVDKAQFITDLVGKFASNPNVTHDQVIAELAKAPPQFAQEAATAARNLPGDPMQLHKFLLTAGLGAQERLKALTPQLDQIDLGGTKQVIDQNPLTRGANAPTTFNRTETPDEARRSAIMEKQLTSGLSSSAVDLAAQRLANGEPASKVLANFGRGKQGAADIAAVQNRFAEVANQRGISPNDIATRTQELASEGRSRLELGAREGKIASRAEELSQFSQQALDASSVVPRDQWKIVNKVLQFGADQSNDPALARLQTAIDGVINARAAAIGGGVVHIGDQKTGHALLSAAQSPEAFAAVIKQFQLEAQGALNSPKAVMDRKRAEDAAAAGAATGTKPTGTRPPLDAILGPKGSG